MVAAAEKIQWHYSRRLAAVGATALVQVVSCRSADGAAIAVSCESSSGELGKYGWSSSGGELQDRRWSNSGGELQMEQRRW